MADLVSIIIGNYNYEAYVADAIESALGQTYPNVEVIVVDDGSTDDSRAVISNYGDRITSIFKENGGHGSALNQAFTASRGQVVMFLDSDDVLLPRAVERVMAEWREGDVKLQFRLRLCNDNLEPLPFTNPRRTLPMPTGDLTEELLTKLDYITPPMSGNAFARPFLEEVLPMPTETWRRGADAYLNLTAPLYGMIRSVDEELGMYRQHDSNGSGINAAFSAQTINGYFRSRVLRASRKEPLLLEQAALRGYEVKGSPMSRNVEAMVNNLISLRLNGEDHPVASDKRLSLFKKSMVAEWKYSGHSARWKVFMNLWILALTFLPLPLLKRLVPQFYLSQARPKWAGKLLGGVKQRVASAEPRAAKTSTQRPAQ